MKEKPDVFADCYEQWKNQEITMREAARRMDVCNHTAKRWFSAYENEIQKS